MKSPFRWTYRPSRMDYWCPEPGMAGLMLGLSLVVVVFAVAAYYDALASDKMLCHQKGGAWNDEHAMCVFKQGEGHNFGADDAASSQG